MQAVQQVDGISFRVYKTKEVIMEVKYNVRHYQNDIWQVLKITTAFGERLDAYSSAPNTQIEEIVFHGTIADCEAYINLIESGRIV